MPLIPPDFSDTLQFYLSHENPCPYLSGQSERKLFTFLTPDNLTTNTKVNATLCRAGFRRSQTVIYRPACTACNACIPIRIPVQLFTPSHSLRRVASHNRDLQCQHAEPIPTPELFALFSAYQNARHSDEDMARMTADDFDAMLQEATVDTRLYQLRDKNGILKGCIITDFVEDGLSAVYSFFTPDEPRRSLGSALVLALIAEAKQCELPFIYLGFWVAESPKMAYKTRFQPLQFLTPQGWD